MPDQTPREQLAALIAENRTESSDELARWLLDRGVRPAARVIETVADLESLPEYSVIRWEASDGLSRGICERFDGSWWSPGNHARLLTDRIPLPAVVIDTPENGETDV